MTSKKEDLETVKRNLNRKWLDLELKGTEDREDILASALNELIDVLIKDER